MALEVTSKEHLQMKWKAKNLNRKFEIRQEESDLLEFIRSLKT